MASLCEDLGDVCLLLLVEAVEEVPDRRLRVELGEVSGVASRQVNGSSRSSLGSR